MAKEASALVEADSESAVTEERIRPRFQDMFLHKICDGTVDPDDPQADHFPGWASAHRGQTRFYIKGWASVQRLTGHLKNRDYFEYSGEAIRRAREDPNWRIYTTNFNSRDVAEQQIGRAAKGKSLTFDRAGLIVLMGEALYAAQGHTDLFAFHKVVKIVPACYNVDRFTAAVWDRIKKDGNTAERIRQDIGQDSNRLLDELSRGYCVTRKTAMAVKASVLKHAKVELGLVRPHPGRQSLGKAGSSDAENVDLW